MENLLVWGLALLAIAAVLLVVEFFVPSAGIIGITAAVVAIAGVVCLYRYDPKWGGIGALIVVVLGPALVAFGLKVWPNTPMGRRIIGTPTEAESLAQRQQAEEDRKKQMAILGKEGRVLTDLRPVGTVEIDGVRHDALSETMFVAAGARVKVVGVDVAQLRVREIRANSNET